ncbi:MAG: DUF167 domain-containing protein [bacterium]|nr:DUF167 domain-containing protein [bacterium]
MYIKVRVTPGQKKEEVIQKSPDHLYISVKEPAKGGAANQRVRELVARHFEATITSVRLISGHTSPSKIFDIREHRFLDV